MAAGGRDFPMGVVCSTWPTLANPAPDIIIGGTLQSAGDLFPKEARCFSSVP